MAGAARRIFSFVSHGGATAHHLLLWMAIFMAAIAPTMELQITQQWSLLKIKQQLNYPSVLSGWRSYTDFCYGPSASPAATVVCYDDSVTQLHITGDDENAPPLPESFSTAAFFSTIAKLTDLKVLTLSNLGIRGQLPPQLGRLSSLEILNVSSNAINGTIPRSLTRLRNLTALVLDHNSLTGDVPEWLPELPELTVVSVRSNAMRGAVPASLATLPSLRVLDLSSNRLTGELPDLAGLTNLQVLRATDNELGPRFPALARKVEDVELAGNEFTGGLPAELGSFFLLQRLDVSRNRFVGPFTSALLALPSIQYLNISQNRFTGLLLANATCGDNLAVVDMSSNLLTGDIPTCLAGGKYVSASQNCLSGGDHSQRPLPYCETQALAVGILPLEQPQKKTSRDAGIFAGIVTSVVVVALAVAAAVFVFLRRQSMRRATEKPARRLIEHASGGGYSSKLLADARYISQTVKLGALGIPPCRSFSLVELEAATNNFATASLMSQDSQSQMFRGVLTGGNYVTIWSLKIKKNITSQQLSRHVETILKLRHRHLVSVVGHCLEYNLDDSTVTRLFLVFEHVICGDLRSRISDASELRRLTWSQRISAAIGVAKGVEFLHGGMIPGLSGNNLKITDVLLDQTLIAKITSYSLPLIAETLKNEVGDGRCSSGRRTTSGDKNDDIYDFGVILLEMVTGKPITSKHEVDIIKIQLQSELVAEGPARRRSSADTAVRKSSSEESVKTVMEICLRCLAKDESQRPSVEDVLWNLQFAAQVEDSWRADSLSGDETSPLSPSWNVQPPPAE